MKFTHGRLCLTFDDRHFAAWLNALPLFDRYQAHATFFICGEINEEAANVMSTLKQHGHSVGLHGLSHAKAVEFVSEYGLQGYVDRELMPQLDACRKHGFECCAFAYPYSQRNEETDAFLQQYEQQERDRLLLFDGQSKRTVQQIYRPAGGVVMRSARFDLKQYSIALRVVKHENVLSVLRGTIVLLQPDLNNTYTVVIQHDRYVSVYRNISNVLKAQGTAVEAGESIGLMTGEKELEFELWESGKPVDPEKVIVF